MPDRKEGYTIIATIILPFYITLSLFSERPAASSTMRQMDDLPAESVNNNGRSPLVAPRAGNNSVARPNARVNNKNDDEDDFGDTDVSSLLV